MSPISPADPSFLPRREFIRDQRPASSFSILALSGTALVRLYSFPADTVFALRKHLNNANLIVSSREFLRAHFGRKAVVESKVCAFRKAPHRNYRRSPPHWP